MRALMASLARLAFTSRMSPGPRGSYCGLQPGGQARRPSLQLLIRVHVLKQACQPCATLLLVPRDMIAKLLLGGAAAGCL